MEKELRNKKIIDMHNSGATIKEIIDATGMSRSGIYKVIDSIVKIGETAPKEPVKEIQLTGNEERFTSFIGWERINVNEYSNKATGEVIRVAYIKAKSPNEFGYFVKLGNVTVEEVKSEESANQ